MFYGDNGSLFTGEPKAYKIFDTDGGVVEDMKNY